MLVMNPKPVMTTRLSSECGIAREGICTRLVMAVARNNRQGGLDLPGTGDFRCVAGFFFAQLIAEGEDEALVRDVVNSICDAIADFERAPAAAE